MKKLLLSVTCLIVSVLVNAQTPIFQWAKNLGGSGALTQSNSVDYDGAGNIYVTGRFRGTVDFNTGAGVFNMTSTAGDTYGDIFILKLDPAGNFVWAKHIGSSYEENAIGLKVDGSGNVHITGNFKDNVDFDPGAGTSILQSSFGLNIFVLKLSTLGNFIWAKNIGSPQIDFSYGISLDASGNIYTTGSFMYTMDFDPGAGIIEMTPLGSFDIFILKLNSSGDFVWARQIGGTGTENRSAIATDAAGNVCIMGEFESTVDFDPFMGGYFLTSTGNTDIFVAKLNASGDFLWARGVGGLQAEYSTSIAIDVSGNIYSTGIFEGTADFDPTFGTFNLTSAGSTDIFILKLNSSGNFAWAKQIGGNNISGETCYSLQLDAAGNIYSTGYFYGTVDFDPGASTLNLNSNDADIFISKLNSSGNFVWAGKIGGSGTDVGKAIAVDASSICTVGYFAATADFDPGTSTTNVTATGNPDGFIQKLSQCVPPSATITASGSTTFCTGGSVTLNAGTGTGITYLWKKNNVTISGATSSSYVATTTGSYTCNLTNSCGAVISNSIQVTLFTAVPSIPGAITTTGGIVKVCPGDIRTYSVVAVAGITYTWTPCAGSTVISGQFTNSITIQYNAGFPASDTLRVRATNACGTSAQRKLKISRNNPGTPSAITGDAYSVCNLSGKPYSVTNVAGMTYAWSFNTGTATVASGQGTSSITANYGAGYISGALSVTATNACGTSAARLKTIYAKPATPASITGSTGVCLNQQDVPYSITPLANVTNYTWTGPSGSHVSDGVTTSAGATLITTATAVTVDFATTAGSVKVRGNNACASGSYKTLAVAIVCREGEFSEGITETRIYPNPASTDFALETDDTSSPFNLEVYDVYGKLVFTDVNLSSGYQVNTDGWASGLYSVVVRNGNSQDILKLVLQK